MWQFILGVVLGFLLFLVVIIVLCGIIVSMHRDKECTL